MKFSAWILISGICVEFVTSIRPPAKLVPPRAKDLDVETSISRETYNKLMALPGQKDCGISGSKTGRIVGGEPAKLGAWPWIAAVGKKVGAESYFFFCGSSLISNKHAVTAAHCLKTLDPDEELALRIGDLNLDHSVDDGAKPVTIRVKSYKIHPKYSEAWSGFDIALIYLKSEVQFTDLIRPICLPIKNDFYTKEFDGYQPFVAGWGLTMESGEQSSELMQVQLPLLPWDECFKLVGAGSGGEMKIHTDSICALGEGKDSCQGDSGGPLMFPLDEKYYLYGVVSYGEGCARPDSPGVYNKVHTHAKWIASIL